MTHAERALARYDEMPRWYADEYGDRIFIDESDAFAAIEAARREERESTNCDIAKWLNEDIGDTCSCETCSYVREAAVRIKAGTYHRKYPATPTGDENE